jgi:hypothetical protein
MKVNSIYCFSSFLFSLSSNTPKDLKLSMILIYYSKRKNHERPHNISLGVVRMNGILVLAPNLYIISIGEIVDKCKVVFALIWKGSGAK